MEIPCVDCLILPRCINTHHRFGFYSAVYHCSFKCSLLYEYLLNDLDYDGLPTPMLYDAGRLNDVVKFFRSYHLVKKRR
jgi:hypothetical protein